MKIPRRVRDLLRFRQIIDVLAKYGLDHIIHKPKKELADPKLDAEKLRKVFEDLGGSFLKLAQLLSLRPDLLPKGYCDEFAKLQDNVRPFPEDQVRKIIRQELGKDVSSAFSKFIFKPLAAASIGQVHTAYIGKKKVAVKVQRPGVKDVMQTDIEILEVVARFVKHHFRPKVFDPCEIVEEFKRYTQDELDYIKEARNIRDFFVNSAGTRTIIPNVLAGHTTSRVLVMEFIDGKKLMSLDDKRKRRACMKKIAHAMMKQIFEDGLFHADPHPGNILVTKDDQIAFLDFGIAGRIEHDTRKKLTNLFLGLINQDLDETALSLVELGLAGSRVDMDQLKADLRNAFSEFYNVPLKRVSMSRLVHAGIEAARKNNLRINRNFVLLGKTFATMEGMGRELDPEYNVIMDAKPFFERLVIDRYKPGNVIKDFYADTRMMKRFITGLPAKADRVMQALGERKDEYYALDRDVKSLTNELKVVSSRIVLGAVIAALIIAAALVSDISAIRIFNIPQYSFYLGIVAAVLLLYLLLSIAFDRIGVGKG